MVETKNFNSFFSFLNDHSNPLKSFADSRHHQSFKEWAREHDDALKVEQTCINCIHCQYPDPEYFPNTENIGACTKHCCKDYHGLEFVDFTKSAEFYDCEEWQER